MKKNNAGFTLIELMIVTAVIGILVAIAIPQYNSFSVRVNRGDECKKPMYEMAMELADFHDVNGTYLNYDAAASNTLITSYTNNHYKMSFDKGTTGSLTTSYLLTCTALDNASGDSYDPKCTTLTLDNFGREGATGSAVDTCWR